MYLPFIETRARPTYRSEPKLKARSCRFLAIYIGNCQWDDPEIAGNCGEWVLTPRSYIHLYAICRCPLCNKTSRVIMYPYARVRCRFPWKPIQTVVILVTTIQNLTSCLSKTFSITGHLGGESIVDSHDKWPVIRSYDFCFVIRLDTLL